MKEPVKSESRIRVVVADDSAFMRTAITRMIESDAELRVVASARNGREALEKIAQFDPDVVTLDLEMPLLDGLGVLRELMGSNPKPVIMISSLTQEGAEATLTAFELGAFDCVPKALSYATLDILQIRDQLIAKIKAAAVSRPSYRRQSTQIFSSKPASAPRRPAPSLAIVPSVVAIGTSTGGPKALQDILPKLPADLPVGVIIVQHMPLGFTGPFAARLNGLSRISVQEAKDGDPIKPGLALLAPATWHMTLFRRSASQYAVRLAKTPAKTLHMPSVDVMMLSAAEVCGVRAMGVILTGMGSDGAEGMKAIHAKGGHTVGQDEATCAVYGMPRACAEAGILDRIVPLSQIPEEIVDATCPAAEASKPHA
jgi:two-component system, chemotaxis family, protein-glutamate methylesterase/glutaminase